jgi:hypothetical protein
MSGHMALRHFQFPIALTVQQTPGAYNDNTTSQNRRPDGLRIDEWCPTDRFFTKLPLAQRLYEIT